MVNEGQPPPGWYNDASGAMRWWDGRSWAAHVTTPQEQPIPFDGGLRGAARAPEPAAKRAERGVVPTAPGLNFPNVHRKARAALLQNLAADELVHAVIVGPSDQAIFGTERRAFIFKKGFMAGASFGSEMTSWDYRNLTGVQLHTGMLSGAVVLQGPGQSGHSTSYWGKGNSDPYKAPNAIPVVRPFPPIAAVVAVLRGLIDAAHKSANTVGAATIGPERGLTDQLRELAELHRDGALDDAEFAIAKAKLIGS